MIEAFLELRMRGRLWDLDKDDISSKWFPLHIRRPPIRQERVLGDPVLCMGMSVLLVLGTVVRFVCCSDGSACAFGESGLVQPQSQLRVSRF